MIFIPILLIMILAATQFAIWLVAGQAVGAAASVGARTAAVGGSTNGSVQSAVAKALEHWSFASSVDPVVVVVSDEMGAISSDLFDAQTGDMVKVTVSVDVAAAVPNLLKFIGVPLEGELSSCFVARRE